MVIMAEGHSWHVECFVCSNCLAALADFHEHKGKLVCKQCMEQVCTVYPPYSSCVQAMHGTGMYIGGFTVGGGGDKGGSTTQMSAL